MIHSMFWDGFDVILASFVGNKADAPLTCIYNEVFLQNEKAYLNVVWPVFLMEKSK